MTRRNIEFSWLAFVFLIYTSFSATNVNSQVTEFDLENGIHVIVTPLPEATCIAVETFHEVGFADEPAGMVQSAHLLEHLVCYSPSAGYKAKEAMAWLNDGGIANAETMLDATHYDYVGPPDRLEKFLEIESSRLNQTHFDPEIIRYEAKRVYQEAEFVENNPSAGMLKYAFMTLFAAWNHQSKSALVRGGLHDMDAKQLLKFYDSTYRPENLTIAISGKTTVEKARTLVDKHFSSLKNNSNSKTETNWESVPRRQNIQWDSKHRAVCISWTPPDSKEEQVVLSLLGSAIQQILHNDPNIKPMAEFVFASNNSWMVGDAPFFVYALAKPDTDLDELEKALFEMLTSTLRDDLKSIFPTVRAFGFQIDFQAKQDPWGTVQRTIQMLERMNRTGFNAVHSAVMQDAINRCINYRLIGKGAKDPAETIAALKSLTQERLNEIVTKTITDENMRVVQIVPQK